MARDSLVMPAGMQGLLGWLADTLRAADPVARTRLAEVVTAHLPEADAETARLVVAVAGLLGTVAYADREFAVTEEARIKDELSRVQGLTAGSVDAICGMLRQHIVEIATVEAPVYARELRELADPAFKREVLDALLDVAAADGEITVAETNVLRATATALGLSQSDYNASQERHRDKLRILKRS
jgi:uncharacterized tellurite resistance protein B-like protein